MDEKLNIIITIIIIIINLENRMLLVITIFKIISLLTSSKNYGKDHFKYFMMACNRVPILDEVQTFK
jgi:hypothetical protein